MLSPDHPSFLDRDLTKSTVYAPLIVTPEKILVDGYRRYHLMEELEISTVTMAVPDIFAAAFELNRRTRMWDETECFLWARWAASGGYDSSILPHQQFHPKLFEAPESAFIALANRRLLLAQLIRILQAPALTWTFFIEYLASRIRLNVNETANFIDMTFDLANRSGTKNLNEVMQDEKLQAILTDEKLNVRQKGEVLLKGMRRLRYPLYQRKAQDLSASWQLLNLEKWQARKSLFLDRGVLELTIRARSQEEMSRQVSELFESLRLPAWDDIWDQ